VSFDEKTQKSISMIVKMLDGTLDIEKDIPKKRGLPPPEEMMMYF